MKILISGGHLTPALAFIDYVIEHYPEDELVFAGRLYSQDAIKQPAQEKFEVERRQVKFIPFTAVRSSSRRSLWKRLLVPVQFVQSVFTAVGVLRKTTPDVFLSFGGYVAVPFAIASRLRGVPIVTHEQTSSTGIANQLIAHLSQAIAISFEQSKRHFPQHKTVLTGNPIRPSVLSDTQPQPEWIPTDLTHPLLLIMGGNQGSRLINETIKQTLPHLTQTWTVIHLCGSANQKFNYLQELTTARTQLPTAQQKRYFVREWVSGPDLGWIYTNTSAAVSRAGANSVAELTARNIPTLYIPLPNTHHNEQLKNVSPLVNKQAALLLPQQDFNPESLQAALEKLKAQEEIMRNNLSSITPLTDASRKLYHLCSNVLVTHAS